MNEVQLKKWIDGGHYIEYDSQQIFVHTSGVVPNTQDLPPGADPDVDGVLIVHGFPGSSWDWAAVVEEVSKQLTGWQKSQKWPGCTGRHYSKAARRKSNPDN